MEKKFDFNLLDNKKDDTKTRAKKVYVAQRLGNHGFSPRQIECMVPPINDGLSANEIIGLFNTNASIEEIQRVVEFV